MEITGNITTDETIIKEIFIETSFMKEVSVMLYIKAQMSKDKKKINNKKTIMQYTEKKTIYSFATSNQFYLGENIFIMYNVSVFDIMIN